jgi:hypothetical protein
MSAIGYTFSFDDLQESFRRLGDKMVLDLAIETGKWAKETENKMRHEAHWTDRSGAARRGLFSDHAREGNAIVARFGHTMEYGRFLELSHGGKYAIVMPTIQAKMPDLEARMAKLLDRSGG